MLAPSRARSRFRWRSILALAALGLLAGESIPIRAEAPTGPPLSRRQPAPDRELRGLGELVREQGYAAAQKRLEPLADLDEDPRAPLARVLLGLLAHAHDDPAVAARRLATAEAPAEIDDWRLYVLADSAAAGRDIDTARRALERLVERYPESPLRAMAQVELTRLAWERKDANAALELIASARSERLGREPAVELEQLAWAIALERADASAMRDAARRLLVLAPLEASKMRLVEAVAQHGGGSDWRLWLSGSELVARAAALLEADLPAGALTTLAAVAPTARGFEWNPLQARALIASDRGIEAYRSLEPVVAATPGQRAELEWTKALAAASAARTRTASVEEGARWDRVEREWLLAVARGEGEAKLRGRALGRLAERHFENHRYDEAIAALHQLAAIDPADARLARRLWETGWDAYRSREGRRAIELWRELGALYPRSSWARSGAYWTARALEATGDSEAARRQYLSILAAHVSDFYARQAALRLAGAEATAASAPAPAPWPDDAVLARVRLLSDLGLDGLAKTELELVGGRADPRARAALNGLVLARSGERRASLRELKQAFPELGGALQGSAPELALELYYPLDFRTSIERVARLERVPVSLVFGMVHQESGFDPTARSRSGALGLMQLMPATGLEVANRLGLPFSSTRLSDPDYSLRLGTNYFRRMLGLFDGNVELALAAYNGGPGRISRWWRAAGPEPELDRFLEGLSLEEPRHYVKRIVVLAESYRSRHPELG